MKTARRYPADSKSRTRSLLCMMLGSILLNAILFAEDKTDTPKASSALTKMQGEMSKIKFTVVREKGNEDPAQLKPEPILRYADPQRAFPDAGLWVWTIDGRPAGFSKLERMGTDKAPSWQYCLTGAHDEKIAVRWPDGIAWKSREASLKFHKMDDQTAPQKTASLRLVQLRNIANRLRASTTDHESNREEMRLLAQPIFRYANPEQGLVDGAVFGVVSNGTNPDALLLVQVRQKENDSKGVWEYGCLGMTGDTVEFELNDKKVFTHNGATGPGDHRHWLWVILHE